MSDITSFSRDKITKSLKSAHQKHKKRNDHIRVLFSPGKITDQNFNQVCNLYSRLDPSNYETAVIVEVHEEVLAKKLPMPSNHFFETPLGKVRVNDYLRNEFCDEDDDFFIHDEAFSKDMCLFNQLMMLQCTFEDVQTLSVQIADENHFIIKELAHVLEEVLASRNTLIIFCCDLGGDHRDDFEHVKKMIEDKSHSKLLNFLNSGESHIDGSAAFIAGIIVAHYWDLNIHFINKEADRSLLTGYADREGQIY